MDTLLLDQTTWDLVQDAYGNIAVAKAPYALAQDASSGVRTFKGECYYDTSVGVDYATILNQRTAPALIKAAMVAVAVTVPDVSAAQCFFSSLINRGLSGQVQVVPTGGGEPVASAFQVVNPQGV